MEEKPFTERWREEAYIEKKEELNATRSLLRLIWYCVKEIEILRQEITQLKQQLNYEKGRKEND